MIPAVLTSTPAIADDPSPGRTPLAASPGLGRELVGGQTPVNHLWLVREANERARTAPFSVRFDLLALRPNFSTRHRTDAPYTTARAHRQPPFDGGPTCRRVTAASDCGRGREARAQAADRIFSSGTRYPCTDAVPVRPIGRWGYNRYLNTSTPSRQTPTHRRPHDPRVNAVSGRDRTCTDWMWFSVMCRHCRRLVMRPVQLGSEEVERLRLHLRQHSSPLHDTITDPDEVLRHFTVQPRQAKRAQART